MNRSEIAQYDVFCGIDVGKASHYMAVFDRDCDDPLMRGPSPRTRPSFAMRSRGRRRWAAACSSSSTSAGPSVSSPWRSPRTWASMSPTSRRASSSRSRRPTARTRPTPSTRTSSPTRRAARPIASAWSGTAPKQRSRSRWSRRPRAHPLLQPPAQPAPPGLPGARRGLQRKETAQRPGDTDGRALRRA